MTNIEFIIPSVLTKGSGEKKIPLDAIDLQDAFTKVTEQLGEDFKRKVLDLNGKPRSLINIYINGKNMRFSNDGMATKLNKGDSIYILPAVAGGSGSELKNEDLQRYSRQIMLDEIGFIGLEKLRKAKICVVGVGGIGNPVVTLLTAMGVGKLKIVDRDIIEISNLHRQHLYTENDIGRVKVEAAKERLQKINSSVEIEALPNSVTKYTAESIVNGFDIVVDALDSIDARYALNDACIKLNIPLIYAGALGNLIDSMFYGLIFNESSYYQVAQSFPQHGYGGFLHGRVVDMLYFPILEDKHFPSWFPFVGGDRFTFFSPIFNIADASISAGVITLLIFQKRFFKRKKPAYCR